MTTGNPTADRLDVCEAVYLYATGVDTRDWGLYRSAFCDDIQVDMSSFNGTAPRSTTADAWVRGVVPIFTGLDASQHSMTNPRVTLDGDRATCTVYMQADHVLERRGEPVFFTIGGYYIDTLERVGERWRISSVTLTVLWRRGDASIMAEATELGRRRLEAAHRPRT